MSAVLDQPIDALHTHEEAVIISGPRKGQIITVGEEQHDALSEEEAEQLHRALQQLDAALVGLVQSTARLGRRFEIASSRIETSCRQA